MAAICVSGQGTRLVIRICITVDETPKRYVEMALFFWTCLLHMTRLSPRTRRSRRSAPTLGGEAAHIKAA